MCRTRRWAMTSSKVEDRRNGSMPISNRRGTAVEASFADLSGGIKNKIDVILNFLAVLTLFRARVLELFQNEIFGDIKIKQCAEI